MVTAAMSPQKAPMEAAGHYRPPRPANWAPRRLAPALTASTPDLSGLGSGRPASRCGLEPELPLSSAPIVAQTLSLLHGLQHQQDQDLGQGVLGQVVRRGVEAAAQTSVSGLLPMLVQPGSPQQGPGGELVSPVRSQTPPARARSQPQPSQPPAAEPQRRSSSWAAARGLEAAGGRRSHGGGGGGNPRGSTWLRTSAGGGGEPSSSSSSLSQWQQGVVREVFRLATQPEGRQLIKEVAGTVSGETLPVCHGVVWPGSASPAG